MVKSLLTLGDMTTFENFHVICIRIEATQLFGNCNFFRSPKVIVSVVCSFVFSVNPVMPSERCVPPLSGWLDMTIFANRRSERAINISLTHWKNELHVTSL